MKFIRKNAEFVGYTELRGERSNEWRCPNCGFGVSEDYTHCPYCGQKIKFNEVLEMKMTRCVNHLKRIVGTEQRKGQ